MTTELVEKDTRMQNRIDLIKRTVAKGATNDEFAMFMHLAKSYQLDPINKEIWFIKYDAKSTPTIMTSRDGYLAIANRNKHFTGMLSDVVHENDGFEKMPDGSIKHKYGCKDRGKIIGAYALGYRDDRKYPIYVFAQYSEYTKNSPTWRQYPSAMILKVSEAMMLKRLFSISGLVTKEEIDEDYVNGNRDMKEVEKEVEMETPIADPDLATQPQKDKIYGNVVCEKCGTRVYGFKCPKCKNADNIHITTKGFIHSHLLTKDDFKNGMKPILLPGKLTKIDAMIIWDWWLGDTKKFITGERTKREGKENAKQTKEEKIKQARDIVRAGKGKLEVKDKDNFVAPDEKQGSKAEDFIAPEDMPE